MARFVSENRRGVWQVDRQRLIRWLQTLEQKVAEEQNRHQRVFESPMMLKQRYAAFARNFVRGDVPTHRVGR